MHVLFFCTKNELARRTFAKYNSKIIQRNCSTVNVFLDAAKSILNPISRKDGEELVKFISQEEYINQNYISVST